MGTEQKDRPGCGEQDGNVVFRPAETDYEELTQVWEASVRATHDFLKEKDILSLRPLVREKYLASVDIYALRDGEGRIAAFMGISGQKLEMLFVHPRWRGCGMGKALAGYAIGCLGVREVDVNEQNPQAAGFYKHLGFELAGRDGTDGQGNPFPIWHMRLK